MGQEVLDEVPSLVHAMRNVVSMLISSDPEFVFRLADVLSPTSRTEDQEGSPVTTAPECLKQGPCGFPKRAGL